jgi:hypothetical protein
MSAEIRAFFRVSKDLRQASSKKEHLWQASL